LNITNEQIIEILISHWVIENNNHKHRFIKQRIIRKFWPELAFVLDELSLSWESEKMLKEHILEPLIFENSHLSIGMSTSQYVCSNCGKSEKFKIVNEYQFNKD